MGFAEPPKRLCTHVRNKCFVFHEKQLFWSSNPEVGGLQGTSNFTRDVIDEPSTIMANQNGTKVIITNSNTIQCLFSPFTSSCAIKTSKKISPGRIKQLEWHPNTTHICLLTHIQEFRVYRVDNENQEPFKLEEKWSLLRFSGISAFCFGPPYQGSQFYTGWARFALFFVKDDGSVLSLCPYTPKHSVVHKDVIEALHWTDQMESSFLDSWKRIECSNDSNEITDYRAYVPDQTPERQFQNLVIAPRQNRGRCVACRVLDFSSILPSRENLPVLRYPIVLVLLWESGIVELVGLFQPLQPYFQRGTTSSTEPVGVAFQRVSIPEECVGPCPLIRQHDEDIFLVGSEVVTQLTLPWLQEYIEIHNEPSCAKRMLNFVTPHTQIVNLSNEGSKRVIYGFTVLRSLSLLSGVSVVVACIDEIKQKLSFKKIRKSSFHQQGLLPSSSQDALSGVDDYGGDRCQDMHESWLPENFEEAFAFWLRQEKVRTLNFA